MIQIDEFADWLRIHAAMLSQDREASRNRHGEPDPRLQTIADLLGVEPEALEGPPAHDGMVELLMLCLELPSAAEQAAALAYLRMLKRGIPR